MSVTIIEASRQNGEGSNSSWVNTYQQPVLINTGDVIQMKQCFVDSSNNNSSNITIDNDTEIALTIGYYLVNSPDPTIGRQYEGDPKATVDYQPYIARYMHTATDQYNEFDPIIKTFEYTLKAGTYTPAGIAETLTRAFTTVKFKVDIPNSSHTVQTDNPFLITTQEIGSSNLNMIFYLQTVEYTDSDDGKKFYYKDQDDGVGVFPRYFIGAGEVSLIWNREGNSKFSFDYLHTPYINEGQPSVAFIRDGDYTTGDTGKFMMFNRRSGVFFTDMSPASFWQDTLGFNITKGDPNSMVVSFNPLTQEIDCNLDTVQGVKTTGGYVGLTNAMMNPGDSGEGKLTSGGDAYGDDNANNITNSAATFAIDAEKTFDPEPSGGFYLLSVSGFVNDFREDSAIRRNIFGILSKNYIQNGYITAYSESGIGWQNTGPPFLLTDLKVEILDPTTKEPVTNVGKNNSVFLELVSAPAQKGKQKQK